MKHRIKNAIVLLDNRYHPDVSVLIEDGKIAAIGKDADLAAVDAETDATGEVLLPGLVDVHTHGRGGYDFNDASVEELKKLKRLYAAEGVTSVFATLSSAPLPAWQDAIARIQEAGFDGIHLEGCFLHPNRRGAHREDLLLPLEKDAILSLLSHIHIPCHVTAAYELDADGSFIAAALRHGATLGLGHTNATYDEAMLALSRGVRSFSHLYNAMPPLHHRAGGAVAAALTTNAYAELICDGFHVSPEMVTMTAQVKGTGYLALISDSLPAAGCADGDYFSAGLPVTVKDGKAYTSEGAIAGSTSSLFDGLKNLVRFTGIPLATAIDAATITPARMVGIDKTVGSIAIGKRADLLLITPDFQLTAVFAAGERIR